MLAKGSKPADCIIGQEKRGMGVYAGLVDRFLTWSGDPPKGYWDGKEWHAGASSDWGTYWGLGNWHTSFSDLPGLHEAPEWTHLGGGTATIPFSPGFRIHTSVHPTPTFPVFRGDMGGKGGVLEFNTFVAGKATQTRVKEIKWGMSLIAPTTLEKDLKYDQKKPSP